MKRFALLLTLLLVSPVPSPAQDPATEERLNQLGGRIQEIVDRQAALDRRLDAIAKELQAIEQQLQNKPAVNYASQDDVRELAAKLKEVDAKRQDDNDRVLQELRQLGKNLGAGSGRRPPASTRAPDEQQDAASIPSGKFAEYKIQSGDTLAAIVKAYADKNIKLTVKQILDANPGLKPERMLVDQKIRIPLP